MTLTHALFRCFACLGRPTAAALLIAALLIAALAASASPAVGQRAALPNAQGFQPLVIPTQSAPVVLPQPIRIPTAILPNAPQLPFEATEPQAVSQPLQYGLPPAPAQLAPSPSPARGAGQVTGVGQQQVMFWNRQSQPLRQGLPTNVTPLQPLYPQVVYPQAIYPQVVYPQVGYPNQGRPQQLQPLPLHPWPSQQAPQQAPSQQIPFQQLSAQPRSIGPIPEFISGKGALQGYKEAAQIAKAQMGTGHVLALIDLSEQRMTVSVNGKPWYDWPVSTGRKGYRTPTGTWGVERMHRHYNSRKYDNAPMPHAMFFHGPYAIHGTNSVRRLGRTASHGCVRLHPKNAAMLFTLAEVFGKDWMTVKVQN